MSMTIEEIIYNLKKIFEAHKKLCSRFIESARENEKRFSKTEKREEEITRKINEIIEKCHEPSTIEKLEEDYIN